MKTAATLFFYAFPVFIIFLVPSIPAFAEERGNNQAVGQSEESGKPAREISSQLDAGLTGTQGNAETLDLRTALLSVYKSDRLRVKLDGVYFYGTSGNTVTRHEYSAGLLTDFYFSGSRWSSFIGARYDWDQFEYWDARVTANAGAGYKLFDTEELEVILRGGGGIIREYGSEDEDVRPEGLFGGELTWQIQEGQKFYLASTYFHDFEDAGEYRVISSTSYTAALAKGEPVQVSLRLGADDEYQSKVETGFEHNDLTYYLSLAVGF